jgi:hypothetical protein
LCAVSSARFQHEQEKNKSSQRMSAHAHSLAAQDEFLECILHQSGADDASGERLSRSQSRRRALTWVRKLLLKSDDDDGGVDLEPFDGLRPTTPNTTLMVLRRNSEMQGDIDFDDEFSQLIPGEDGEPLK